MARIALRCRIRPRFLAVLLAACLGSAGLCSAQTFTWSRWPMPTPRHDHVAIYDPVRDRMVVYGGRTATDPDAGDSHETWHLRFDVPTRWELGAAWGRRSFADAVHDPIGDRMVVSGGEWDGSSVNNTSQLALPSDLWSGGFTGSQPPGDRDNVAVFDAPRRRMVLVSFFSLPNVHQLDLATNVWSTFSTVGAVPQQFLYAAAHDIPRDRLIVRDLDGSTWELTLSGTPTWAQLTTSGTPPGTAAGSLFFDAVRDRLLEVKNADGAVWALSMDATPSWTSIAIPPLPTGTHNAQIVHDAARDQLLWFGGSATNDTWAFRLATARWYLADPGSPIPGLARHSAVAAPPWDALVIFGGSTQSNATWRLPMSGGGPIVQVATAGPAPPARHGHAAIYDPVRQRMIVFGGNDGSRLNDTWALSVGPTPTWSQIFSQNSPPSVRELAHAIYDPIRDRMVMLGGVTNTGIARNLVALTLDATPTWATLAPDAALPELAYTDLVYDSRRDRLIAIGADSPTPFSNTRAWWMPAGGPYTWTEFAPPPFPPTGRSDFAATYDWAGDRVLVHGGVSVSGIPEAFDDFLALNPVTGAWTSASGFPRPLARVSHTLTRDPGRERFVLYGGVEVTAGLNPGVHGYGAGSVWFAKDPQTVLDVSPEPAAAGGALVFRRLWLAAPDRIAFELSGRGGQETIVEAFDVAGRMLGASVLPAGASPADSGEIRFAAAARPGVVFVRARQHGAPAALRRLAVLR